MDPLTAIAASGMRSRTETLDLLANNIANAGTSGYKADSESYDLYFGSDAWDGFHQNRPIGAEMPLVQRNWTNFSQGTLMDTGHMGDVALSSEGFFVVQTESGPLYTRTGHFRIGKSGRLETEDGYAVRALGGKPIQLDPAKPFIISTSGQVSQDNAPVGNLEILSVDTVDNLTKRGGTYFMLSPGAKTSPAKDTEVLQGKVEASNVEPTQAAVKLVGVLRQFETLQKAVRIASEMGKEAVEQVAKVG
jgi:flagellar basal-body rod protein FlgF